MATRTPGLQNRSQYGSYWGQYASAADLPNASGNPLANPYFAQLEAGDIAFVTGGTLYVCISAGTLSGSDAVWSAAGGGASVIPTVPYVTGLAASGYEAAAADLPGSDSFTIGGFFCLETTESGGDLINYEDGVGGYRLWFDGSFFRFEIVTAGGVRSVQILVNGGFFFPRKWIHFAVRHTGSAGSSLTEMFMNAKLVDGIFDPTSGVYVPPVGVTPKILVGQAGADPATSTRCEGVFYSTAFLSSAQIATLFDAAYHAGQIVQSGALITRGWSAKSNTPGATWAPSIGVASDLTLIGGALPSGTEDYPLWL